MEPNEDSTTAQTLKNVLVTGATGYVGGLLVERLLSSSVYQVRCLVRDINSFHVESPKNLEVFEGDLSDPESIRNCCDDVDVAFFLVHAMGSGSDFEELERKTALHFAEEAKRAGVKRIVYLGGLGEGDELSPHLESRQVVGDILRGSGIPVIEFRASIILGPGSLSYELIRSLTSRLPVMILPRWTNSYAQPIAIADVLEYLMRSITVSCVENEVVEIGGPDKVRYSDLLRQYAEYRGLKRVMIPVPVLSLYLSSLWLGLITPIYARIGRKLVESLRHDTVVTNPEPAKKYGVRPVGVSVAFRLAIRAEEIAFANKRWCDAVSSSGLRQSYGGRRFLSRLVDIRFVDVEPPLNAAFAPVQRIGGTQGWYFANFLWKIRGWMDLIVGGVGMRRGRRHPVDLRVGDVVDCWRVEAFEPGSLLRLRAEMKLPGRAWLQFETKPLTNGKVRLTQTALFDPIGVPGLLYWYGIYPLHFFVFRGMISGIARAARQNAVSKDTVSSIDERFELQAGAD